MRSLLFLIKLALSLACLVLGILVFRHDQSSDNWTKAVGTQFSDEEFWVDIDGSQEDFAVERRVRIYRSRPYREMFTQVIQAIVTVSSETNDTKLKDLLAKDVEAAGYPTHAPAPSPGPTP